MECLKLHKSIPKACFQLFLRLLGLSICLGQLKFTSSKISIKQLADKITTKLSATLTIPQDDNQGLSGNPKLVNIGLQKYTKEFGKNNFVDIDVGIKNTIEWQKYILQ